MDKINRMFQRIALAVFVVSCFGDVSATVISGKIVDADSGKPIPYVNVGVVGKTLGTLTDSMGYYYLDLSPDMMLGTLRISCIGYLPIAQSAKTLKSGDVLMTRSPVQLSEIEVLPAKTKGKVIGRKTNHGLFNTAVERKSAGTEIGIRIKAKKRVWIKAIGFAIAINPYTCKKMKLRVNVYRKSKNDYQNILNCPIEAEYNKDELFNGVFRFSLPEKIMLQGEGLASIEFLEDIKDSENFIMPTTMMKGKTYFRKASQDHWKSVPVAVPIFIEADFEE